MSLIYLALNDFWLYKNVNFITKLVTKIHSILKKEK